MEEKDKEKIYNLAIDAMGGDNAPMEIINGVIDYINLTKDSKNKITLVGNEDIIQAKLMSFDIDLSRIEVVDAKEVITGEDHPTVAIRDKKDSSMAVGLKLLKDGKVDAFVSAGNTGALVVGGTLIVGPIKGIKRPALAPILPNMTGVGLLIDCGANVDAKPLNLVQFAQMGAIYMQNELDIENPTVGLINIGTEEGKGNELVKETFKKLKETDLNFVGNVESREVFKGGVDVYVCDAFVGNVLLKHTEGMARDILGLLKDELKSSFANKVGALICRKAFKNVKKKFDYSEYGGAPLLGLKGLVVKAHGNSTRTEICACLKQAEKFAEREIAKKISDKINGDDSNA